MGVRKHLDIWTAAKIGQVYPDIRTAGTYSDSALTREAVDLYTRRKLRETLEYAVAGSAFYEETLSEGLLSMGKLDFMEAFQRLPFMTPEDLRHRNMELLCVKPGEISRIVTLDTGGSTGAPKRIYFTEEDQRLTVDFFQHGMQLIVDSSDHVLILMPTRIPGSIGRLLAEGLKNFGARPVDYGLPQMGQVSDGMDGTKNSREAEKLLQIMQTQGVASVVALPTHMRLLAEAAQKQKKTFRLKSVLLSAEYVSDEDVRLMEKVFGCKVYQHYGMTEMGLGCAVSCGQGEGYHIRELDLYLEIIDPETGMVIEDQREGEIVFTTLTRKGMPFVRYRTGDYSHWITEPCCCGSVLKRMAKVGPRAEQKGYLR